MNVVSVPLSCESRSESPLVVKHWATPVLVLPAAFGGGLSGRALEEGRIAAEAGKAEHGVVELVVASAARQRDLRRDVEARFAEQRIVAVDALLLGQPDQARDGR